MPPVAAPGLPSVPTLRTLGATTAAEGEPIALQQVYMRYLGAK